MFVDVKGANTSTPEANLLVQEARLLAKEVLGKDVPNPIYVVDPYPTYIAPYPRHSWGWWGPTYCHPPCPRPVHGSRPGSSKKDKGDAALLAIGICSAVVTAIGAVVLGREYGTNTSTRDALDRLNTLRGRVAQAGVALDADLERVTDLTQAILERRLQNSTRDLGFKVVWLASGIAGLGGAMAAAWPVCQGAMAIFGFSSVGILGLMGFRSTSSQDEADARQILVLTKG